jgi:2-C-methyl-D-erythritol 4-phosphate cytidylyltransferase
VSGSAVIIPAAGIGSRFGGELPKQFQALAGKPILLHVVERFLLDETVARIIVPVAEQLLPAVRQTASDRVTFVAGGASRQQSVMRGLEQVGDVEIVAVHDAVRPFFVAETFHAVVNAAREFGAALPVLPVADTIHVVNEDVVMTTLERSTLAAAQTPQCFRAEILRDVLARAEKEGVTGTDEAGLAARFGYTVKAIPGDPRNLKITVPEDLAIAESYLEQWSKQ